MLDRVTFQRSFDLPAVRLEVVAHQQGLVEQVSKVERPVQTLEAADECRRVAHGDHHFAVQALREPIHGKDRERILHQHPLAAHQAIVKDGKVASHSQEIAA